MVLFGNVVKSVASVSVMNQQIRAEEERRRRLTIWPFSELPPWYPSDDFYQR